MFLILRKKVGKKISFSCLDDISELSRRILNPLEVLKTSDVSPELMYDDRCYNGFLRSGSDGFSL